MKNQWEIEDYINEQEVFINGISGEPAHSDGYMTIIDYKKLVAAIPGIYSKEEWSQIATIWINNDPRIPALYIAGKEIQRQLTKIDNGEVVEQ